MAHDQLRMCKLMRANYFKSLLELSYLFQLKCKLMEACGSFPKYCAGFIVLLDDSLKGKNSAVKL